MSDHLLDEIVASPDKLAGAMQVVFLADDIRKRLLANLRQQLLTSLPDHDVELTDNPWARYSGLSITYSEQSPYRFSLEFDNSQFNGLGIGISRKIKNDQVRGNEYEEVVDSFGAPSEKCPNDWWLWWRWASPTDSLLPVPKNWQTAAEPWVDIVNKSLAARIEKAFRRTQEVLTACGVG